MFGGKLIVNKTQFCQKIILLLQKQIITYWHNTRTTKKHGTVDLFKHHNKRGCAPSTSSGRTAAVNETAREQTSNTLRVKLYLNIMSVYISILNFDMKGKTNLLGEFLDRIQHDYNWDVMTRRALLKVHSQ